MGYLFLSQSVVFVGDSVKSVRGSAKVFIAKAKRFTLMFSKLHCSLERIHKYQHCYKVSLTQGIFSDDRLSHYACTTNAFPGAPQSVSMNLLITNR